MTETRPDPNVLDLDHARAARHEGDGDRKTVRFGGQVIAVLPVELPLRTLQPLLDLNVDVPLLVRQILDLSGMGDEQRNTAATGLLVDILTMNPNLPRELIDAVQQIGRNLFGDDGYQRFLDQDPSGADVAALVKGLLRWYGVSLGESPGSSVSPPDGGGTSKSTSNGSTDSTPADSTVTPPTPISLESGDSPR